MFKLKDFISALQFLTIFPFKNKPIEKSFSESTVFFPVVGLFLGTILGLTNTLLTNILTDFILSTVVIFLLSILTGCLHLDGFADTIDAFYSGKNKDEILNIMRDSHIGTIAVVGLIGLILLKIGFLTSISQKFNALLIMPVLSRYSMVFVISFFKYARKEGKAKDFFEDSSYKNFFGATLITIIIIYFILGFKGFSLIFLIILSTFILAQIIKRKIDGATGDTLGAINEINELLILIFLCTGI